MINLVRRVFDWFESRVTAFPAELPDQPPASFWPFIWHYTRPFLPLILICSSLAVVTALIEVSLFAFVGQLVDWLAKMTPEELWREHGTRLTITGVLVVVALPILKFFYDTVLHQGLMGNFGMRIRWQAHRYVMRQSMTFFQDEFAGRVATKVMQTALAVRDVVLKFSEVLLYVSVYLTGALALFAGNDWRLAIPLACWAVGYILTMRYFIPRMGQLSEVQADMRSMVTGRIVDSYTNVATVKLFAHAAREDAYAREGMDMMMDAVHRSMRLTTLMTATMDLLNSLLLFSTAALGIWLWYQGAVTGGAIAFTVGFVLRIQGMAHWILWEVAGLFENIGVVHDGLATIARTRSVQDEVNAPALRVSRGEIIFDRVRFNYARTDGARPVVNDLSLTIRPGEKVGLVGRSGAGKSTLVNLLLRFYDIESGRILIDGQDIARVSQESLRAHIGMVTQDTSLLHRSVIDNIRYGLQEASLADVRAAARKAHADEFIAGLADLAGRTGYEAHVGERGVKLSGGQRQRVAIARVLLKNAPILVLDEATSALDSEVEQAIQENLYTLMEGKTVIAVAHRLSTIAAMDRLIVMDRGQIIEQGSHAELLNANGLYAGLWTRQSGGFIAPDTLAAE